MNKILESEILIAQYCGFKQFPLVYNEEQRVWARNQEEANSIRLGQDIHTFIPHYSISLESMYQAENKLQGNDVINYERNLQNAMNSGARVCDFNTYSSDFIWHASVEQRFRAFLTTIENKLEIGVFMRCAKTNLIHKIGETFEVTKENLDFLEYRRKVGEYEILR